MENASQVVTKSILFDRLSEQTHDGTENSLKMHISNLRNFWGNHCIINS